MKAANLDYERAPRPAVVFGCLVPAPWLGAAAGLLLAAGPADGLPDRFAPLALVAVHVLALGMLMPVMVGALFQMMPVVAGVAVPGAGLLAPFVAVAGAGVAAGLGFGLLGGMPQGMQAAAAAGVLLLLAGALLLMAGRRVAAVDATTRTLAGIGAPMLAAVLCGIALAGTFGGWWHMPVAPVLGMHMAWALGGWLAALVTGVATTVLPMFWQTRRLPAALARGLPMAHWVPLALFSGATLLWPGQPALGQAALLAWLAFVAVVAACGLAGTLRARRRQDPLWLLWPVASASMLGAAVLGAAAIVSPASDMPLAWWAGTMALVGTGVLPVTAMLGKIVPFLVWLHLRRLLPPRARVPAMQAIIVPARQRRQAWLLLAAYLLLLALPLAPVPLARTAGLLLAAANAWLGWQLLSALRCMRQMRRSGGLPPRHAAWNAEGSHAEGGHHHG
ncbi:hypothetical protein [Cupriavidus oxalaticus]|jgi:hypothetical protein|uniref:Transmembrane protein n=1 Tax=Cupriavidus oxalaticus TaxID=96344 RepID=A0A375GFK2_9BURK|nr:hypothetical protein [Cupriavidus oxalaticus]QRQ84738.1 hypothetical protein JTE91_01140 [Cupriavidus oxalaticus]QRQ91173.1 hypothetical protein JTE92_11205 [Cupriavidus oxalaticus]WQD85724.1 hypothetical protein U0036_29345 [Cupriavidus oxalaticus]SPC20761.1 conserved membrane hypothetical protein [Cupriavidus oxalaticus]